MWVKFCKSTIGKVCVAFNKVFQTFMNVPSYLLYSWLFLICDVMNQSPTHRPLSAHHCVLVGQGPLPQRTIYFNQPLSAYVDNDKIGRKPAIADDIYHYPE